MTTSTTPKPSAAPRLRTTLRGFCLDAALAIGPYLALRAAGVQPYYALLGGALVIGLWLGYGLLRTRRLEGFAAFMCVGFLIGTGIGLLTGSEQFLLLKGSFTTAIMGLLFLGSCFVGKPFIFYASKRFRAAGSIENEEWERKWRELPGFRKYFRTMTAIWAAAFITEAIVRVPLIYLLPIDLAATVSEILMPVMLVFLLAWTVRSGRRPEQRATPEADIEN